jgi:cytosine/adenosine deaminase-related metal-dependent hydrolase
MDWLRQARVADGSRAHAGHAARLGAAAHTELLGSGTTSVLTMETVHDTDVVFEAVAESGLRATIGKCMMDFDAQVPARLQEDTQRSLDEELAIATRWHGAADDRLHAAFAPRFAVSCSRGPARGRGRLSDQHNALVHTHAAESRDEIAIVKETRAA